jgi:uncharacterized membrane protein (UPF0127 family)
MLPRVQNISIGEIEVSVEVANCLESRRKGLMNRISLDENSGMLFIFSDSKPRSFWMYETYLPLSIAYIDELGIITEIRGMVPLDLNGVKSSSPAKFALEMNEGWFDRNKIRVGNKLRVKNNFLKESRLKNKFKKLIKESYEEIIDVGVKLRIKITSPTDPTMQDILTDIRGIKNVITVKQEGQLYPAPDKKQWTKLTIRFEDDESFDLPDLERGLRKIEGIDLVFVKTYDGKPVVRS